MPWNQWQGTSAPATGTSASVAIAPPSAASTTGQLTRLRALEASVAFSSGTAGTGAPFYLQVLDGATQIFAQAVAGVSASAWGYSATGLDLRASLGNSLTVQFTSAGPTGCLETVNIQGDFEAPGQGYGKFVW